MKTREELNKEYEVLQAKIEKEQWVLVGALTSMFVVFAGFLLGLVSPTLGGAFLILGFFGMIGFGSRGAHLSVSTKELERQWRANGYGLKKYPTR
jgi:hypothetical protein